MSTILNADVREKVGTRHARALRAAGRIPASLQSSGEKSHLNLSINEAEFLTSRRQHQHLFDLKIGAATETALVNDLSWDVFGERIEHVEFRRVERHVKTDVMVTLEWYGTPKAGVLVHEMSELEVSTTPDNIPNSIVVRVGALEVGDTLRARDVELPANVALSSEVDPEDAVARVAESKVEEEPAAETEAEILGEAAGTVEVPSEGKSEDSDD